MVLQSKKFYSFLPLVGTAIIISGCLSPASEYAARTSSVVVAPATGGVQPSQGDALYLKVETAWENNKEEKTTIANCKIPYGSAPASFNCAAIVPEAQLFYSDLTFTSGTADRVTCSVIEFSPYFYQGSSSANFFPTYKNDTSATVSIDCSAAPINADCFNGVAKVMVPTFPNKTGFYYLTSDRSELVKSVASANELGMASNKFSANNLADQVTPQAGVYVGNSMQNYRVDCRDFWNELHYSINFTLNDEDYPGAGTTPGGPPSGETPGGPGTNHFSDWN